MPTAIFRTILVSAAAGSAAGLAATALLYALEWTTATLNAYPALIYGLPLAGLVIGYIYLYAKDEEPGYALYIDELYDVQNKIPFRRAPLILITTAITHLFGGSAGREVTAVKMGATLADSIATRFGITPEQRQALLMAGAGAGFGAAVGTPIAGAILGMEIYYVGKLRWDVWLECLVASFAAYGITMLLQAPHTTFAFFEIPTLNLSDFLFTALAGILVGVVVHAFAGFTHIWEWLLERVVKRKEWMAFAGGLVLAAMYKWEGSLRYASLGIPAIQQAFEAQASFRDPLLKAVFTAITIGSRFKGGRFVPLLFIGATLGSALSLLLPVSVPLLAAVGLAAAVAVANRPLACAVMAMELFGWRLAPYALIACYTAWAVSAEISIFQAKYFMKKVKAAASTPPPADS